VHTSVASMKLRAGVPSDAPRIAALIASFQERLTIDHSGAGAEEYVASVSEEAERRYLESDRYAYLVAEEGDALVGAIAIRDGGHVFHLFVAAGHHGRGLARRLWQEARADAVRRGNRGPFTVNASLNAVPVYRTFGFVPTGPVVTAHGIAFLPMRLSPR
jgi:GNAT superfamily N-acetyltransferase